MQNPSGHWAAFVNFCDAATSEGRQLAFASWWPGRCADSVAALPNGCGLEAAEGPLPLRLLEAAEGSLPLLVHLLSLAKLNWLPQVRRRSFDRPSVSMGPGFNGRGFPVIPWPPSAICDLTDQWGL